MPLLRKFLMFHFFAEFGVLKIIIDCRAPHLSFVESRVSKKILATTKIGWTPKKWIRAPFHWIKNRIQQSWFRTKDSMSFWWDSKQIPIFRNYCLQTTMRKSFNNNFQKKIVVTPFTLFIQFHHNAIKSDPFLNASLFSTLREKRTNFQAFFHVSSQNKLAFKNGSDFIGYTKTWAYLEHEHTIVIFVTTVRCRLLTW